MNQTKIYTTRKLEKTVKEYIYKCNEKVEKNLGEWAATLFFINNKKCWLVINKMTKYLLILQDVKKSDLKNISSIFKETFYTQLIFDGILVDYKLIEKLIGKIQLCETDNDRSANGFLNNNLLYLKEWKYEFGSFEKMPFRELNSRLNSFPIKSLNWKYPKEKMAEMINIFSRQGI